jgi:NAD(P)-dependent dehydrogenase (short-subunit alcohol dehydrogenase family)
VHNCDAGGNSGLGKETARCLAAAGADVTLTARSAQAGDDVAAELKATGVKASMNGSPVSRGCVQRILQAADAGEQVQSGVYDRACQRPHTYGSTSCKFLSAHP